MPFTCTASTFSLSILYNIFVIFASETIYVNISSTRMTARNKYKVHAGEHIGPVVHF